MVCLSLFGLYWVLTIGASCIQELISLSVPQSADRLAEVTVDLCEHCNQYYCIHELISLSVPQSANSLAKVTSGLRGDFDHSYLESNTQVCLHNFHLVCVQTVFVFQVLCQVNSTDCIALVVICCSFVVCLVIVWSL